MQDEVRRTEEPFGGRKPGRTIDAGRTGAAGAGETTSRARHGNALRAAVLGSTDGLVSNLSLVMGVAGSGAPHETIIVAGLAGLVAGSLSMALGEYLSVQSARELFANELRIEALQLAQSPDDEVAELREIYLRKGVPARMADELAEHMVRGDPRLALDTMAREELGFDPDELGGSAWVAAGTSLALFALGALVPLLAFFVANGSTATVLAAVSSVVAIFALGAGITRLPGPNPILTRLRTPSVSATTTWTAYGLRPQPGLDRRQARDAHVRPRASRSRPQRKTRTAMRTPNAARTRIAAAAIEALRSPAWNSE